MNVGLAGLEKVAALGPDWDTYGAPPIKPEVIEEARRWILALEAQGEPAVCPGSDGSITLHWMGSACAHGLTGEVLIEP